MADVRADPEKLRQFAGTLARSADQLESMTRQLSRSLDMTGWQDSERQRFEEDFRATVQALSGFTKRLRDTYVPQLRKKAEALDRFRE